MSINSLVGQGPALPNALKIQVSSELVCYPSQTTPYLPFFMLRYSGQS